uniref:Beta/alpha-defensin C-terminal domain-containing protein n=1 Tax=Pelusios castaneus TaxID=367368 RepID=A0A8C8S7C9_9SAUR
MKIKTLFCLFVFRIIPPLYSRCLANGGRCFFLRCPPGYSQIGLCAPFLLCCKRRVNSEFYKGDFTVPYI